MRICRELDAGEVAEVMNWELGTAEMFLSLLEEFYDEFPYSHGGEVDKIAIQMEWDELSKDEYEEYKSSYIEGYKINDDTYLVQYM
jgi:hypothetical protein